ncbi:unnamed protein product [Sphenostylis stenocarpa]|uniref:Uncharacterized protein n=1 Tax=Sphenostylis stenocarpa TaxID=92480 RepID=A0AA86TIG6_9FABA|nr:unnamed protein product [Sphenostylis stenocarpa]
MERRCQHGDLWKQKQFYDRQSLVIDNDLDTFQLIHLKQPSIVPQIGPSILVQNEQEYEEYIHKFWNERAASHLGASTSAPFFRECLIKDPYSSDVPLTTRSRWWARSQPGSGHGQTSFFGATRFQSPNNIQKP